MAQAVKCLPATLVTQVRSLGREDPWRREWQPTPVENGMATHPHSYLENPMDRGSQQAAVHGMAESQTQLNG